jgi:O-antigen/teichoic acid export membrane protein
MVTSFAAYLVILEFGTSTAITRNLSRSRARNESKAEIQKNISSLWTISLILALIIVAVAVVFYAELGNINKKLSDAQVAYAQKILAFEIVYLVISFLCNTMKGIVLGFEEYKALPVISIARTVCRTVLVIAIVLVAKYAIVIAIVDAAISLVVFVFFFFYCIKKFNISFSVKWFDSVFSEKPSVVFWVLIQTMLIRQIQTWISLLSASASPEQVLIIPRFVYYSAFSTLTTVPVSMYGRRLLRMFTTKLMKKTLMAHLISPSRIII